MITYKGSMVTLEFIRNSNGTYHLFKHYGTRYYQRVVSAEEMENTIANACAKGYEIIY